MNANKGQLLKPEEQGWRWTELYLRAMHPGTLSSKTKFFKIKCKPKQSTLVQNP